MNRTIKAYIDELTVDSKCSLNEMLADFYRTAGHHTSFNGVTEQEKVRLRKLVEELDMHDSFTAPFLENFNADLTPIGLFEAVKGISSIANAVDVRIGLEKLYRHPEASINIKDYVKIWLMQPLQVLDKLNEFLGQMMFDDEQIFTTAMNDPQLFTKAVKKAIVHPEDFNLLSFVVFNENAIPARVHSLTEEVLSIDIAGASTIKDIHERIGTIKMEDVKGPETGLSGLRNATECLLKIHQAYPIMQANMINYSTRSINSSMTGGVKLSASQVVNLYAGDYSNYTNTPEDDGNDKADMADSSSVRGLIINPEAFNALPPAGRSLVAQHLPATRKQFNQIVVNAINSVHTWMPQLLNAHTDNRELNRVIDGLSKSYNSITGNQQGMVDWFMHKFAPAVNAYRSRAMPSTGIAVVDNVFSGSPVKASTHIYGSGMNGGAKRTYINRDEDTSGMRLFGGGPIADYFEGVKRAQLKFNEQFDSIYRKLTTAVRMVADKGQFTAEQGIERIVEALMSITIASKKTVMKLSGLTPRKDLNARYTSMVEHVIKTIENTKIGGFNEVISTLRSLVSALRAVKQEAAQLIKRVSEATKSSEEIVKYMSVEREEMPSKLSANELHALVEAINALTFAIRGNQLTPKIERHREEDLKEYVKKVTDRATAINHYYDNLLDTYIKWNRNVTADTRNLVRAHVKSVQSAMLYLNEKVDTKLIEWRRKMAKGGNLTKKQIEDIERLTMTYMHYRPGEKILQIFGKLEKLRKDISDKLSIGDLFKITGVIHKIVMNAGYIEMIQQLYRTLEIDDGTFDWNVFKINITKLLVDKIIAIDDHRMTLKVNSKGTLINGMIAVGDEKDKLIAHSTQIHYYLAKRIHTALAAKIPLGYNQLFNLCVAAFTPLAPETGFSAINSAVNMIVEGAILCTGYANRIIEKITRTPGDDKGEERLMVVTSYDIHKKTFDDENAVKAIFARIDLEPIADIVEKKNAWADRDKETPKGQALRFVLAAADHVTQILERHKVRDIYTSETIIKFADELCKLFIETSADGDDTKVVDMHKGTAIVTTAQDELNLTWDGYYNTSHETTTIVDIFHSMIANVLYVFNRYIGLRYTGSDSSLPIPIMSSAMLGGGLEEFGAGSAAEGSKMEAGSAIDVIGVHDLKFDRVIPEAVPFYAIALDIFSTFMKERWNVYNDKAHKTGVHNDEEYGDNKFNMYVTISEFSLLHQLHEILKDYTIDSEVHRKRGAGDDDGSYNFKNLSQTQLKMIIAELNKIWNLVNGSGKDKLMNAIDYIIGEINASILYTTKSRYEQLKRDGGGDFDITSKVAQQFDGVLNELEQVISDNISLVTTLRPDAMVEFESFLTTSVERVKRETNEVSRLNYVLTIINDDENVYKTPFEDYYKFCEFVITPIMITATSYKEAFELFSRIKTTVIDGEESSIDLNNYSVALYDGASSVFVDEDLKDVLGAKVALVKVTDICEGINGNDAKILAAAASLVNSAVVARYNGILIKQAINTAMMSNRSFVMPNIWLPLVPSTYPKKDAYKISTNYAGSKDAMSKMQLSSTSITMHELFPQIKSEKISDFFNAILQEFSADFDHLLHTFMTYPGISDRFLMQLKETHENSITSLKHLINKGLWDGNDYLPADMMDKKLTKVSEAFVPPYPEDLNMQPYMGTATVPAISLQRYGDVTTDVYTMLNTGQKVYSISIASDRSKVSTAGAHSCHYGPLDWVIYKLAACNTTGYTLPVMLYEMLKNNSLFGRFLVECVVDGSRVMYTPHSNGYVNNIVTQNILTRSSTERNRQESADMKTINKPWIANLVSTIPGLISYLKALGSQTDGSVKDYNGISVEQIYVTLTTILESFYEECVTYMPFVPFMSDFIPGTFYASIERKMSKYHPIAEIYGAMTDDNCDCDGLKFEWANRAYYSGTMLIPFPEYKNRDKYENLKQWGGSLFQNSLFAHEFEGTMDIIARSIIRHRIIKRNSTTQLIGKRPSPPTEGNIMPEVVDICYNAVRKCYELDPTVIELFITNIIRLARGSTGAMLGGWTSYAPEATTTAINGTASSIVSRLLTGIFANLDGLTASEVFNRSSTDIATMVNAAISLLYDNPNMRPFYGFVDDNARNAYKSNDNLIRGDLNIRGSMKLAAENITPDATTRAQQLLAYSVVNEKGRAALNDDTLAYNYTGTIGTSARYAFKNAAASPSLRQFREKLRNATYDSASMIEALNAAAGGDLTGPQDGRTDQQKTISALIEGYANMDRLLIATNAMASMVKAVFDGLNINTAQLNAVDRGYLADIFNWLSLSDEGALQQIRYIKDDAGVGNLLLPITWNVAHGGGPGGAASTGGPINGKRWDEATDVECLLGLSHIRSGGNGTTLTDANRTTMGRLLKALMLVTHSGLGAIDDILKFVGVAAAAGIEADAEIAGANNNGAGIVGKALNPVVTGNALFGILISGATPTDEVGDATVNTTNIAALLRTVTLYVLFTRFNALSAAGIKAAANAGLIAQWCKWFGITINGDTDEAAIGNVLKFIATVIEIGMRTPAGQESNMVSMVAALGPKLNGYLGELRGGDALNIPAPGDDTVIADPANYQAKLANSGRIGRTAVAIFDAFHCGSTAAKIAALKAGIAGAGGANMNANIWTAVIGRREGVAAGATVFNARGYSAAAASNTCFDSYSLVPITYKDGAVAVMDLAKSTIFGKEYEHKDGTDITQLSYGFGKTEDILNALSSAAGPINFSLSTADKRDGLKGLIDAIYGSAGGSVMNHAPGFMDTTANGFIRVLKDMGFLSLIMSPLYSFGGVKLNGNAVEYNMLGSSFYPGNANVAGNIWPLLAEPTVTELPISASASDAAIQATFADLAIASLFERVPVNSAATYYTRMDPSKFLIKAATAKIIHDVAKRIDAICSTGYMTYFSYNAYKGAVGYPTSIPAAVPIGIEDHPENHIFLSGLPTILPAIRSINNLTVNSVKIYQHLPRMIGEYMLWNPGYELSNLPVAEIIANDLINIPFNTVVNPAASYTVDGGGWKTGEAGRLIITNTPLRSFSMTPGLFDPLVASGVAPTWYNIVAAAPYGGGINYRAVIYSTSDPALNPLVRNSTVKTEVIGSKVVNTLIDIIDKWCNSFSEKANTMPKDDGWSLNMLGGALDFDKYISRENIAAGEPYKIYPHIYPTAEGVPGLTFYGKLFKTITRTTKSIGSLALAYFNRSLLTFSGILSNLVYPNAIYGKSLFNHFADALGKAVGDISADVYGGKFTSNSTDKEAVINRWKFYVQYVSHFSEKLNDTVKVTASERALYALNQCCIDDAKKEAKDGIRKFNEMTINSFVDRMVGKGKDQSRLCSEFTAPSICNSFMTILHNLILGKTNDNKDEVDPALSHMEWFMGTETMGTLRSVDVLLTYTSVVASLIKQLSFFDMDENMERPYIPRDPAEPYMGVKPEQF